MRMTVCRSQWEKELLDRSVAKSFLSHGHVSSDQWTCQPAAHLVLLLGEGSLSTANLAVRVWSRLHFHGTVISRKRNGIERDPFAFYSHSSKKRTRFSWSQNRKGTEKNVISQGSCRLIKTAFLDRCLSGLTDSIALYHVHSNFQRRERRAFPRRGHFSQGASKMYQLRLSSNLGKELKWLANQGFLLLRWRKRPERISVDRHLCSLILINKFRETTEEFVARENVLFSEQDRSFACVERSVREFRFFHSFYQWTNSSTILH